MLLCGYFSARFGGLMREMNKMNAANYREILPLGAMTPNLKPKPQRNGFQRVLMS